MFFGSKDCTKELKLVVEREMSVFLDNHALPDTSMRLSDYVLQTFLVNIFSLAIANFKMAAKFIC